MMRALGVRAHANSTTPHERRDTIEKEHPALSGTHTLCQAAAPLRDFYIGYHVCTLT